jgi:uncharacterized membrane protein YeaQ/YmgE (transglycosylase-associated protein family)
MCVDQKAIGLICVTGMTPCSSRELGQADNDGPLLEDALMTMEEAIALQPPWLAYWLYWLVFGAVVLPLALLIWRQSRIAGLAALVAGVVGGYAVGWLYDRMGYVKLLGLPHIIVWTPLAIYLFYQIRRADMPKWPRWIMIVVLATILISLAFDYVDVLRYLLGERTPFAKL